MSKKFGKRTPPLVNPHGRGLKTENPKNLNKKHKNIYKILVENEDDQENLQKNHKNTKPNKKLQNRKQHKNDDKSNSEIISKDEDAIANDDDDIESEIIEIKSILQLCSLYLSEIRMSTPQEKTFDCDAEGCDKKYKQEGRLKRHQVEKHGAKHELNESLNSTINFSQAKSSTQNTREKVRRRSEDDEAETEENKKVKVDEKSESDDEEPESPGAIERRRKMQEALDNVSTQAEEIQSEQETQENESSLNLLSDQFMTPNDSLAYIPMNPNAEIIKEHEDRIKNLQHSLNYSLAETENLKTQLALANKENEKLTIKLDKKNAELEQIVEEAQRISAKAANKDLPADQRAMADEIKRLRKLNSDIAAELEDAKTTASSNALFSTNLEKSLKEAYSKIQYLERRLECRDPKCSDAKRCGKSHDNKFKSNQQTLVSASTSAAPPSPMDTSTNEVETSITSNQCNFYNRGTCKNTEATCKWEHNKEEKLKFIEEGQKKRKEEREKERKEQKEKKEEKEKAKGKKKEEKNEKPKQDFQKQGPKSDQPDTTGGMGPGSNMLMNPMMMVPQVPIPMMPQMNWQRQQQLQMEMERTQALLHWQTPIAPGSFAVNHLQQKAAELEKQLQELKK